MHIYHLRCELITSCSLPQTFEIFKDPNNLAKITPNWLNFQVITPNVEIRKGAEIEYNIRWLGLPMHWVTVIAEYEPPHYFVDEQSEGPYALWRHRHTFEETVEGTRVADHVEYGLPLGKLGEIAHSVMVRKQLEGIFNFRQKEIGKLLDGRILKATAPVISG